MPIYTPPYSVREFNAFHSRSEAIQAVQNADPEIPIRLRDLLNAYQVQHLLGVALVYKHYPLNENSALFLNKYLMPYQIEHEVVRDIELHGQAFWHDSTIRPVAWAIVSANKLMPYQFARIQGHSHWALDPRREAFRAFLHEFLHIVDWADLTPYLGLKLLSATDSHDIVSRYTENEHRIYQVFGPRAPRIRTPSPSRSRTRRDSTAKRKLTRSGSHGRDIGPDEGESTETGVRARSRSSTVSAVRRDRQEREKSKSLQVPEIVYPEENVREESSEKRPYATEETAALSTMHTEPEPEERLGTPTEEAAEERRQLLEDK